jgi:hypothetical protein
MALTGDGRLLVVELGADRLSIIDLATCQIKVLVSRLGIVSDLLSSKPSRHAPRVCCINPPGIVYVTAGDGIVLYHAMLPPP